MDKELSAKFMVEDIVGCKWALTVIDLIKDGVNRPGVMVREQDGLTTKVLNERLNKMLRYGILEKKSYHELPPRVEYYLTERGLKFVQIVDQIRALQKDLDSLHT